MIKNGIRFLCSLWGWLVIAVLIGGLAWLIIGAQERYHADLDLRVWQGK